MIKAYKYKLKPNKTQEIAINQFLGSARFIYNWGLNRKSEQYKLNGTSPNYNALAKELTFYNFGFNVIVITIIVITPNILI